MEQDQISVQRLMDRFRDASKDLFDRHFNDEFVAERFGWVQDAMFLVMVLNYFDLSAKKEVYPEIAIAPKDRARAAVQNDSRLTELAAGDVLHYRYFFDAEQDSRDMAVVVATVAQASDAELVGHDVALSYADCRFIGSVDPTD
ncbi:hypothetical protein [Brevundimonas sp.]|uniref:hypothetical protein n=1 Tax=Brevundimonas sp. TaxID=1871086 RepID=UPI002737E058|nr:hypothetical protein [Brevundimonas sp.]MDP3802226.1 hypothetical protein [Brevundimonas sp.]